MLRVFVVLIWSSFAIDVLYGQICPNGQMHDGICYILQTTPQDLSAAARDCVSRGQKLALFSNQEISDFLTWYMKNESISRVWTGISEIETEWQWLPEGTISKGQGCYNDWSANRDLPVEVTPFSADPDGCIRACAGYMYAGLQRGYQCFCGNTYGAHGATTGCTVQCQGDTRLYCGGYNKNSIFIVQGAGTLFSRWSYNQPDNRNGFDRCAFMGTDVPQNFYFDDQPCGAQHQYICNIPSENCTGVMTNVTRTGDCLFISTSLVTWFEAYSDCLAKGGHLAKVDTLVARDDLQQHVTRASSFWIGLVKSRWNLQGGTPATYFNFAPSRPSSSTAQCVQVDSTAQYRWTDVACTQKIPYFCQDDFSTTTEAQTTDMSSVVTSDDTAFTTHEQTTTSAASAQASSESSATTTPGALSPSTIQSTATKQGDGTSTSRSPGDTSKSGIVTSPTDPDVGQATQGGDSNSLIIALAVFTCVLVVAVIVAIAMFVYYKKTNKTNKVSPEKTYDARPDAPVANAGNPSVEGDEFDKAYKNGTAVSPRVG